MKFKIISIILCIGLIIYFLYVFRIPKLVNTSIGSVSSEDVEERNDDVPKENNEIITNNAEGVKNSEEVKNSEQVRISIDDKITNVLLLGIDKEENASDTIMILSSNKEKDTIKLTSIMRDTYVYQGEGMANKINYAYHYGGVEGSINTVNEVFDLDIDKYIKVTFDNLINIVDKLDGVEINVTEEEKRYINLTPNTTKLKKSGDVILSGDQAVAYSRIRKLDSDFYRTARQRKVMLAIFHKIKNMSILDYPSVISNLMHSVETNLTLVEMLEMGNYMMGIDENNLDDFRIPMDGTTKDNCQGVYHLDWDRDANVQALHDYIYN